MKTILMTVGITGAIVGLMFILGYLVAWGLNFWDNYKERKDRRDHPDYFEAVEKEEELNEIRWKAINKVASLENDIRTSCENMIFLTAERTSQEMARLEEVRMALENAKIERYNATCDWEIQAEYVEKLREKYKIYY